MVLSPDRRGAFAVDKSVTVDWNDEVSAEETSISSNVNCISCPSLASPAGVNPEFKFCSVSASPSLLTISGFRSSGLT